MKQYLAFDIGCIECSESSSVIGVYKTETEAEKAIEEYITGENTWGRKEWNGQHECKVFEINLPG